MFSNPELGTKEVGVRFFGPRRVEDFDFFATEPDTVQRWLRTRSTSSRRVLGVSFALERRRT